MRDFVYVLLVAKQYSDGGDPEGCFTSKKKMIAWMRQKGFKYSRITDDFFCDKLELYGWYRKMPVDP